MLTSYPDPHSQAKNDPIIASYPIHLTSRKTAPPGPASECLPTSGPRLLVLQYPAHRPSHTPYNAQNLQKPTALRVKPETGILELDIPIDTVHNYNPTRGSEQAQSLIQSQILERGGAHGLAGGFNTTGPAPRFNPKNEDTLMTSDDEFYEPPVLATQTLSGKIVKPAPGSPVYMLGSLHNGKMHLSHLDALIQVRPELHHLDAADEMRNAGGGPNAAFQRSSKGKDAAGSSSQPPDSTVQQPSSSTRPEAKPIDLKLKASAPFTPTPTNQNTNSTLLRSIQQESWQTFPWTDQFAPESLATAHSLFHGPPAPPQSSSPSSSAAEPVPLHSALPNSSYLDHLSAPRIEHGGKPGEKTRLLKVQGRERERQRRKRNEQNRRKERAKEAERVKRIAEQGYDEEIEVRPSERQAGYHEEVEGLDYQDEVGADCGSSEGSGEEDLI